MTAHIDPDCRDGKHLACQGFTFSDEDDVFVLCDCECHDGKEEA